MCRSRRGRRIPTSRAASDTTHPPTPVRYRRHRHRSGARVRDPLPQLDETHLGIATEVYDGRHYHVFTWRRDDAGGARRTTTWALYPDEADANPGRAAIVNYHADDPERLLPHSRVAGITVERPSEEPYGRFAWISDPEGNRIELYQDVEPESSPVP